jgi:hypothetical protein
VFPKSLLLWREKVGMRGFRANTFTLTSILARQGLTGVGKRATSR